MSRTFQRRSKLERTIITSIQVAKHRETLWHSTSRRVEYVLSVATLVKRVTVSCTNGSNILLIRTMNGECKSFTRALMRLLRARSCVWIYTLVRRERISIIARITVFTSFVRVSFITVQCVKVEQLAIFYLTWEVIESGKWKKFFRYIYIYIKFSERIAFVSKSTNCVIE